MAERLFISHAILLAIMAGFLYLFFKLSVLAIIAILGVFLLLSLVRCQLDCHRR